MDKLRQNTPELFEAFIKSSQYLVRVKTQQDIWEQLGKFVTTYFSASWTAIAGRGPQAGVTLHYCSLSQEIASQCLGTEPVLRTLADVQDSGFLATQVISCPEPSMTAFIPIVEQYQTQKVLLIGHPTLEPVSKELLNIYLALAGLAGTASERLHNELELNRHRTQLEALVKERTAELELSNTELESFSYSVSHDLRAPLRSIDGFSQAFLEDYSEQLDDQAKTYLNHIRESAQLMSQLIDDMLELSRITRAEIHRQEVDLTGMAESILGDLGRSLPGRQVEFIISPGLSANADRVLLNALMRNLLENAWKFTSRSARARIEVGSCRKDNQTVFFVSDNGAGFDMQYRDKLFKPFQRLHSQKDYPGTGIGLANVMRIVRRHGGQVWAEAEINKGAVFYFTLGTPSLGSP